MLWTCLHLPALPLEAVRRGLPDDGPAVAATAGTRPLVVTADAAAARAGVMPGMTLSAALALALAPALAVHERDEAEEARALAALAAWALQFTPVVSLAPPFALLLEVGGCLRLHGGLPALLAKLQTGLDALGYEAQIACAPTPLAAELFARAGQELIVDADELEARLDALPLGLLDYPEDALLTLAEMGVQRIADARALPRGGLARRFGPGLAEAIDRALGRLPDPRTPFVPPASWARTLALPSPVQEVEPLLFGLRRLLLELAGWLAGRGAGVASLKLELLHEDGPRSLVPLGLARPGRDPERLLALLREKLSRTELASRVEAMRLASGPLATLAGHSMGLFGDDGKNAEERSAVIERLRARLGDDAVLTLLPWPEHRPERAWRAVWPEEKFFPGPLSQRGKESPSPADTGERPLWLLAKPRPLAERRGTPCLDGPLTLLAGPERIESGWWDGADARRDYFIAAGAHGERLWVYREAAGGWFVHGLFA